jgi:CBS domain-containing protein
MLLVRHVMAQDPKFVRADMDPYDAASLMASFDIGAVPVVDEDERLVGIVTDRDLAVRVLGHRQDPDAVRLGDIATDKHVVTVTPDTRLSEARSLMAAHRVRRLPVVKGEQLVGMVSLGDVAVTDGAARAVGDTLAAISESPQTAEVHEEGPDPGTPDRVAEARRG